MREGRTTASRGRSGLAALLAALAAALALHPRVLAGDVLSVADALYALAPWQADPPAGWKAPANKLMLDQVAQVHPWAHLVRERLRRLELPLWNPHTASGVSLVANPNAGLFVPFHLLLPAAPDAATGLTWVALAKLVVAFLGARALAGTLGASPGAALLAGLLFAWSGPMIVWLGHPLTTALPFLPWSLACAERAVRGEGRAALRPLAGLAAATAAQYLSSHPETAVHTTLAVAAWIAGRAVALRGRRAAPAIAGGALAMALGFLAAGVQVLPFLDALGRSHAATLRAGYPSDFSLPREAAALAYAPRLFGTPMELTHREDLVSGRNFAESCLFAGVLPLVVVPAAAACLPANGAAAALALLGLLGLAFAGDWLGVTSEGLARLPLIGLGAHQRLLMLWVLALAVLAPLALEALARSGQRASRAGLALAVLAGFAALALGATHAAAGGALYPRAAAYLVFAAAQLAGAAALVLLASRLGPRRALLVATALAATDLYALARGVNPTLARAEVFPASPALAGLRAAAGSHRVAALGRALPPNTGIVYGLDDVRGYEPLFPDAYQRWWREAVADRGVWERIEPADLRSGAGLGLLGVGLLAAPPGLAPPPLAVAGRQALSGLELWSLEEPMPPAFALFAADGEADPAAAGRRLREGFPFRRRALLDVASPALLAAAERDFAPLAVERPSPERAVLTAAVDRPAVVVFAEGHDPGWRVRLDGEERPLRRAFGILLAVEVGPGAHRVEFDYRPAPLAAGLAATLAGLAGLAALWWAGRRPS